jgi:hypothetical protein
MKIVKKLQVVETVTEVGRIAADGISGKSLKRKPNAREIAASLRSKSREHFRKELGPLGFLLLLGSDLLPIYVLLPCRNSRNERRTEE